MMTRIPKRRHIIMYIRNKLYSRNPTIGFIVIPREENSRRIHSLFKCRKTMMLNITNGFKLKLFTGLFIISTTFECRNNLVLNIVDR